MSFNMGWQIINLSRAAKNWKSLRIFFFRTTGWNETKFDPNNPWVGPLQNCVCWPCLLSRLVAMADNEILIFQHYLKFLTSDLTNIFKTKFWLMKCRSNLICQFLTFIVPEICTLIMHRLMFFLNFWHYLKFLVFGFTEIL